MKKITAIILLVLAACVFCSCKGEGESSDTTIPDNGVIYEYDENDPNKKTAAVVYENGVAVSRDNYSYDAKGNIKTVETVKNGKVVKTTSYVYEGDINTQIITEFEDDGIVCREVADIDLKGRINSITYYEDGEKSGKVLYSYDSDGNMVKEETVDDDGNVLAHKENTYDGFGKLIRVDCYEFGSLSLTYEYTYKDGVIHKTKCFDSHGDLVWEK